MNETIVAISTSYTAGAISIVRLSGDDAIDIVNKSFKGKDLTKVNTNTINYGHIYDGKEMLDEVMVSVMRAPKTYTKEDVVEINCHGSILASKKILETVISHGAILAEPGEFTKRAYLNGRIDLAKAESVADFIASKNNLSMQTSFKQLKGDLSNKINQIRSTILESNAFIEAALDDPEHIEIAGFTETLKPKIQDIISNLLMKKN